MPRHGGTSGDAQPLDALLAGLGYTGPAAHRAARAAIERAKLTNARKRAIHPDKAPAVEALLSSLFSRTCGSPQCDALLAPRGRELVRVERASCEACGGRRLNVAVQRMLAALRDAGCTRLLVAGGAPGSHEELRNAFAGSSVQLDLIDGERAPDPQRIRDLARHADVVVVWASTVLPHKVSNCLKGAGARSKTLTVAQRSVEALATAVASHCGRSGR